MALLLITGCVVELVSSEDRTGAGRPVPMITQLVPDVVIAGQADRTLIVLGGGFVVESVVRLDASDLPTTYAGPNELHAELPVDVMSRVASHNVTVFTPLPGGGTSEPAFVGVETVASTPTPLITTMKPASAMAGQADFSLTVYGSGFSPGSRVLWNGAERGTSFETTTRLSVAVSAADVSSAGAAQVVVRDDVLGTDSFIAGFPVLPGTQPASDVIVVPLSAFDLVADPARDVVYATIGATSPDSANTVLAIDVATGDVLWSVAAGSDPTRMAINEDGSLLWVGLEGEPQITRIALPSGAREPGIDIGGAPDERVEDLVSLPHRPGSVVATIYAPGSGSPAHRAIVVYDDVFRRAAWTNSHQGGTRLTRSAWSSRVYGFDNASSSFRFDRLRLGASGVVPEGGVDAIAKGYGTDIVYDEGLTFSTNGEVFDPERLVVRGSMPRADAVAPDVHNGRVHLYSGTTLTTVHYSTFTELGSLDVPEASGAHVMVRFGRSGVALAGGPNIVLLRSDLVGS